MTKSYVTKCLRTRFSCFSTFGFLSLFTFVLVLFLLTPNAYSLDVTLAPDLNQTDLDGLIKTICKIPLLTSILLWILLAANRLVTQSDYFVNSFHKVFRVNRRFDHKVVEIERRVPRDVRVPFYLPMKIYLFLLLLFFATCLLRWPMK